MFNLRIKQERNSVFEQNFTTESLTELFCYVSLNDFAVFEITKNGKVFAIITCDNKTNLFLSIIRELSAKMPAEIIPKSPKRARKTMKKQKGDLNEE